ncbi:MAG TPA: hypothetical protein VJU84_08550 [Pyrinomonadaceae bacterium]|nr:hypothetical protein [Pyrinomonadaceae bacterium]
MNPHALFEIDGFVWDSWKHSRLFSRVSVELPTNEAALGSLEALDKNFVFLNRYTKPEGVPLATVRIWMGFGPEIARTEPVFKGLLARVERGQAKTTLVAYDMALKMRLLKKTEYHKGDDLKIMKKLVERNGLKFQGPANPLKLEPHSSMSQDEQTDWEHVLERARESGLVVWVREDTLFADYPAKVSTPSRTLTYRKDFTLLRDWDFAFRVPENVEGRPKKVQVRGRGRGGKRLTGESDENSRGHEPVSIKRDLPRHTKKAASRRAQAQKELDREHAFTGRTNRITGSGFQRDDVRQTVRVLEIGKLFSGDYIVDRVNHEFVPGRLTTGYELYRDVKE